MKNRFATLMLLVCVGQHVPAQNKPVLKGEYLGQKPPGMKPELFAPGIISTKYYEHSSPAFSPDGISVLWTVIYERGKPARLMEMHQQNGVWTEPASPTFADVSADDFYPSFSDDGKKLYFNSRRKVPAGYKDVGLRIWEVDKTPGGWSNPIPFDTTVSVGEDYGTSMTKSGNIYFAVRRQNGRVFDVVHSRKTGSSYQRPETLPYNINTNGSEDGAFIAPDESYLIFESARPGSIEGSTDLYISFGKRDGTWGRARNMGPNVNSRFTERFPRLSPDGKYLFFGSDRDLAPGAEGTDVYWIDAKVIDDLRRQETREQESAIDQGGIEILSASYGNDFAKLASLLKQWLQVHPADEDAFVSYIRSLRRSGQIAEADRELNARKDLRPNIDMKMEVALLMYASNRNVEAEKYILSQLSPVPEQRNRYTQLANQLYGMKKYAESASMYMAALKIQPSATDFYNMACSWSLAGKKDNAFEALNNAADNGYSAKSSYETDTDLTSLKSDTRWNVLMLKLDAPFNGATPYKRAHHELVYDQSTKSILMIGGSTPLNGGQSFKSFNDIWAYSKSGWRKVTNAGDERSGIRLAYDTKRNRLLSYGGHSANQASGQLRVLENGEWKVLADSPELKAAEGGFVYDADRDKFIAFGGSPDRGMTNSTTWEWSAGTWKKIEGATPGGRQAFAMVYDSKRKRTIIFGGTGSGPQQTLGDTWEFDGSRWEKVSESGPEARLAMGFAYDSKNGMMIIFGGIAGSSGLFGDTWGWNGKVWKKLSSDGPAPRMMGYMAYDSDRERVVMFGGRLGWPNDAGDTWEWDGAKWIEVKY